MLPLAELAAAMFRLFPSEETRAVLLRQLAHTPKVLPPLLVLLLVEAVHPTPRLPTLPPMPVLLKAALLLLAEEHLLVALLVALLADRPVVLAVPADTADSADSAELAHSTESADLVVAPAA